MCPPLILIPMGKGPLILIPMGKGPFLVLLQESGIRLIGKDVQSATVSYFKSLLKTWLFQQAYSDHLR